MKQKISYAILLVTLFSTRGYSQITFEKTYGGSGEDESFCGIQTPDGGYLAVGRTVTPSANPGIIIQKDDEVCEGCDYNLIAIKTDAEGVEEWTTIFQSQEWEWADHVINAPGGGYVIAGRTAGLGAGGFDALLVKINNDGEILWTNSFGGAEEDRAYCVREDTDGGFLVCGRTKSFSGPWNGYLVKTDSAGNLVWQKNYGANTYTLAFYAQRTEDGGIIISGRTQSLGQTDATLIKTDSVGNVVWQNSYGGPYNDRAYQVVEKTGGGYVFCGSRTNDSGTNSRIWALEVDENGVATNNEYLYGEQGYQWAYEINKIPGGYILAGRTNFLDENAEFNMALLKLNNEIEEVWVRTFGGAAEESGLSVDPTTDGGFLLTGWSRSFGDTDILLIKTDSLGKTCSLSFEQNYTNPSCDPFVLYPVGNFDSLAWSDGSSLPHLPINESGNYYITAFKEGCVLEDSLNITVIEHPNIQPIDTALYNDCFGVFYDANGIFGFETYLWSNNDTTPYTRITIPTELFLIYGTGGCTYISNTISLAPDSSGSLIATTNATAPDSASISWLTDISVDAYEFQYRMQEQNEWETIYTNQTTIGLSSLECNSDYEFRIRANCSDNFSGYTTTQSFQTQICTGIKEFSAESAILIYPNPSKDVLAIKSLKNELINKIIAYDSKGSAVINSNNIKKQDVKLDLSNLPTGIYFLKTICNNNIYNTKFTKE
jgi:Secretion system C-terminal sorting domain